MKKQQSLLGKSNDSSYLAKRFATPVKVTSGIGLLAAGAIAVVGNGIDFPLPTYGYWKKGSCLKKKSRIHRPYENLNNSYISLRVFDNRSKTIQKRNRRNSTGYSCAPFDVGFLYRSSIESTVNNLHRIVEHLIEQRIQIIAAGTSPADFFTYLI